MSLLHRCPHFILFQLGVNGAGQVRRAVPGQLLRQLERHPGAGQSRSSSRLRTILANLADRGVITATHDGYRISDAFRIIAMDLLR